MCAAHPRVRSAGAAPRGDRSAAPARAARTSGIWTSVMKRCPRFSRTMPSEAAKKARMWLMKCRSSSFSVSQSAASPLRSISSAAAGQAGLLLAPHASGQRPGPPMSCLHCRRRAQHAPGAPCLRPILQDGRSAHGGAPVQKLASAFLYISHTSLYLIGNMQKRSGFSVSSGSAIWPTIACVAHQSK